MGLSCRKHFRARFGSEMHAYAVLQTEGGIHNLSMDHNCQRSVQ